MTRRRWIIAAGTCLVLVGVAFFSRPVAVLLGFEDFIRVYRYESSDRGFEEIEVPEKNRRFALVQSSFRRYADESKQPDVQLFRTFPKESWRFWNWREYATHPRWRLPYRPSVARTDLTESLQDRR